MRFLAPAILSTIALVSCVQHIPIDGEEIESRIVPGSSRSDSEAYLESLTPVVWYDSRAEIEELDQIPDYEWRSTEAVGVLGARIRDVRTRYYMLASEHIEVRVEIDENDKVMSCHTFSSFTGP